MTPLVIQREHSWGIGTSPRARASEDSPRLTIARRNFPGRCRSNQFFGLNQRTIRRRIFPSRRLCRLLSIPARPRSAADNCTALGI